MSATVTVGAVLSYIKVCAFTVLVLPALSYAYTCKLYFPSVPPVTVSVKSTVTLYGDAVSLYQAAFPPSPPAGYAANPTLYNPLPPISEAVAEAVKVGLVTYLGNVTLSTVGFVIS